MLTVVWLPMTCAATIVIASHCVGLTFPGIMLLPGSFSGKLSSPNPQRGPEPRYRMSLAIFMSEQAMTLRAPWASTRASWVARASNCVLVNQMNRNVHSKYLVRGSHELQAGDFRHFCGDFDVESFLCVQTLTLPVRKCANEGWDNTHGSNSGSTLRKTA